MSAVLPWRISSLRHRLALTDDRYPDWSDEERGLLQDFAEGMAQRDPNWELCFGRADDGAPWAAVFRNSENTSASYHFARIGANVIGARPERGFSVRGKTVPHVLAALGAITALARNSDTRPKTPRMAQLSAINPDRPAELNNNHSIQKEPLPCAQIHKP